MSDTPETDTELEICNVCGGKEPCSHDFDAICWPTNNNEKLKAEIEELSKQNNMLVKALEECREDSMELLIERDWWKDEPRCGYMKDYKEIQNNIARADEILAIVKGVSNE
jgi:hypothetical protein